MACRNTGKRGLVGLAYAVALFAAGCNPCEEPDIDVLMGRLRKGDADAIPEIVKYGNAAFPVLKREFEHPQALASNWMALRAMARLNDKRVLLVLGKEYFSDGIMSGEWLGIIDYCLEELPMGDFRTYGDFEAWFHENEERLDWDEEKGRFQLQEICRTHGSHCGRQFRI